MNRARYILFRTVQSIFIIWIVITFLFFFFRLLPGDYTDLMVYRGASPETVAAFRAKWGLDDPLYVQYFHYLQNLIELDMGTSLRFQTPVWEYVRQKIFNTFILVGPAITAAYIVGSIYGTILGMNRDSPIERYGTIPVVIFGTVPSFFLSILLVVVFANWLNLFPSSGMVSLGILQTAENWWDPYLTKSFLHHYILPFTAVFLRYLYLPSLIMRTSVVETLSEGYTKYQEMVGLPWSRRFRTLGKNSSLPIITLYPVSMTRALGGLVLIEAVFNWPGIGFALIRAVLNRDTPIVQFIFVVVAVFIILANFAVDLIYGVIDPRVSVGDSSE